MKLTLPPFFVMIFDRSLQIMQCKTGQFQVVILPRGFVQVSKNFYADGRSNNAISGKMRFDEFIRNTRPLISLICTSKMNERFGGHYFY